jgi:hypothetical protein
MYLYLLAVVARFRLTPPPGRRPTFRELTETAWDASPSSAADQVFT